MPIEQFKNGAVSTLSGNGGGILEATVNISVADGSVFPTSGVFRALCGMEIMIVGGRSGNTLSNVTRGAEFTTPAIHTDGDVITHIVTAGALKNLVTPTRTVLTPPPTTGWTWDNQGASVMVDDGDSIVLKADAVGNIPAITSLYRPAPAPPYSITAMMMACMIHKPYQAYGLSFRQSSDGKQHGVIASAIDLGLTVLDLQSIKIPNGTSATLSYLSTKVGTMVSWMRITDDGTNRVVSVSADGLNFLPFHTIGRTDYLVADQVAWFVSKQNLAVPNYAPIVRLLSWAVS